MGHCKRPFAYVAPAYAGNLLTQALVETVPVAELTLYRCCEFTIRVRVESGLFCDGEVGINNKLHRPQRLPLHKRSRQTQHPVTSQHQLALTRGIRLHPFLMVNVPVNLDDEHDFSREKVDDEIADDLLTLECDTKTLAADSLPKKMFRSCWIKAHVTRSRLQERLA